MSEHFSNYEIENFINGKSPLKEFFKISQHIIECLKCRESASKISPDFFRDADALNLETRVFKSEEHYSSGEITAFLKAELPLQRRLQMSNHIRECSICKNKTYAGNPDHIKQSVQNYLSRNEDSKNQSFLSKFFTLSPILAFALIIAFLGVFMLINWSGRNQKEFQSKISDNEILPNPGMNALDNQTNISANSSQKPQIGPSKTEIVASVLPHPKSIVVDKSEPKKRDKSVADEAKNLPKTELNKKQFSKNGTIISESRSLISPCSKNASEVVLSPYFETVTETQPNFRWQSFPNAIKYQIYISDKSKILIDQFETARETSYKSKIPLTLQDYQWQVIVTLADGTTTSSGLVNFAVGKMARKLPLSDRKKIINPNRCIQ